MLTERDKERLAKVDSRMVRVFTRAALDNPGAFFIDKDAARDVGVELDLMKSGKSRVKNPYSSLHVIGPKRPLSLAVDAYPTGFADLSKIPAEAWERLSRMIYAAAAYENVKVKNGWDLWKWDRPHWQLMEDA